MMKIPIKATSFVMASAALIALAAYLALWPVPVSPAKWTPPPNPKFTGMFAPNTKLANLERLGLGGTYGPEDAALWHGQIYTVSQEGDILAIDPDSKHVSKIAQTGGVPLGIEVDTANDRLIIADAYKGLLAMSRAGDITVLADSVDGSPIAYADDLDIADDGVIYLSDASTKFGAQAGGGTLSASLLELMEHGGTGRLLAYDPSDKSTRIVTDGFTFANGVAMHPSGDVLVLETGSYALHKINPVTGAKQALLTGLPGFPDNINHGPKLANGKASFFISLISPRSDWLDKNAGNVGMRKFAMRLPAFMQPKAVPYVHILHMDEDGKILESLQDPAGGYHDATGAIAANGYLYITSLTETSLARTPYP